MATVLLVDDDPHQRAFAAMVLADAGHAVHEAADGAEGLRRALGDPPELIVCDVVMPHMNGYQMVAAVRAEPSICTTPVILLTSLAGRAQVRAGMTAGADDYLAKPFQPAELRDAVQALLQRRKAQFDAIAGSLLQDMDAALEQQREVLAARYESQLLEEINSKWKTDVAAGSELAFPKAALVVADLYRAVEREEGGPVADYGYFLHLPFLDVPLFHGKRGEGVKANEFFPAIAGKPAGYLYAQLVGFRDRRRHSAAMKYIVAYLSDAYLREIAD